MFRHLAFAGLALASLCMPAHAQLFRAYLSSTGNDTNPCTLAAPCRLLPAALNAVAIGGEIWMLDSANYNTTTVQLTKPVSILSVPGAQGSLVANGATAILVPTSGIEVSLRNVNVVPVANTGGAGTYGLLLSGNSSVTLDHCLFANLPDSAIRQDAGELVVSDSVLRENNGWGVLVSPGSAALATITNSRLLRNDSGAVLVQPTGSGIAKVGVADSAIVGKPASAGVRASTTTSQAFAIAVVSRTSVHHANTALGANTTGVGTARLTSSGNTLALNNANFTASGTGASINSSGDNLAVENGSPDTGSLGAAVVK